MGAVKRVQADPIRCHACGLQVLGRGGDLEGWKAVQMDPAQAELRWYCMKPICQYAYVAALQVAQETWVAAIPAPIPVMTEEAQEKLHQQVRGHLQRQDEMALSMDEEDVQPEPKEPPPMLLAYETSSVEEAGFDPDEEFPFSRFGSQEPEEPKPEPPKQSERYVPTGSPKAEAKFIRHKGTGEPDE